ncbi:MAG: TolC family protein, partial [Sulfuricaulis sp.]|uniref:TolC family protein n=1 Tax=Sulfuricaulis sp. TaxID=2003553 RepID=UPI003C547FA5
MYYRIIPAALLLLAFTASHVVRAETFSLEQAVSHALAHNPDLLAVQAQSAAASARTQTAAGARLPSLGVSYS